MRFSKKTLTIEEALEKHGIDNPELREELLENRRKRDIFTRVLAIDTLFSGTFESLKDGTDVSYRVFRAVSCYWYVKTREMVKWFREDDPVAVEAILEEAEKIFKTWDGMSASTKEDKTE